MQIRASLSAISAALTIAIAGYAADVPVEGTRLIGKSPPHGNGVRFLFRSRSTAITDVASPVASGASVEVIEADCSGSGPDEICAVASTSGTVALPGSNWIALGNPPGQRGYRYHDPNRAGGIRRATIRNRHISIGAAGDDWPWRPLGGRDITVVRFTTAGDTYCSEFGGQTVADQAGFVARRNAPAPSGCRSLCGDGIVEGNETCDPPDGGSCSADCQAVCPEDSNGVLVDCVTAAQPGLGMSANGATFIAAYARYPAGDRHLYFKRMDASGQPQDEPAVQLTVDIPEATSFGNYAPQLTPHGGDFYAVWSGSASVEFYFINYFHGRAVPLSGAPVATVDWLMQESPIGQCNQSSILPIHVTSNLTSTGIHTTWPVQVYCGGPLYQYIVGVPGQFAFPPPGNVSFGGAPLATGSSDVAAVWWNLAAAQIQPPHEQSIKAGWISPGPSTSVVLTTVDPIPRSTSPALAVNGDLFFAVWTIATGPAPAVPTQVRGMRFTRADGPLDPQGGILIASSANGAALEPQVAADGDRFIVAWRETTMAGSVVRAVRVDTDGVPVDPQPIEVAASDGDARIALAASPSGTLVGLTRAEGNGLTSIRVVPLP